MEKTLLCVFICAFTGANGVHPAPREESSPVLIWTLNSSHTVSTNASPLQRMFSEGFEDVLKKLIEYEYRFLVFVEKFLDVEDFLAKNKNGQDCFKNLKDIKDTDSIAYFPRVNGAMKALERVTEKYGHKKYNITTQLSAKKEGEIARNIVRGNEKVVILHFLEENAPHLKYTLLGQHDKIINNMCRALEHVRKTMCIYTGHHSYTFNQEYINEEKTYTRYSRKKRSSKTSTDAGERISLSDLDTPRIPEVEGLSGECEHDCTYEASDEGTLISIHLAAAPTLWYGDQEIMLKKFLTTMVIVNESLAILKLRTPDASLSFNFNSFPNGNWFLNGVTLEMKDGRNIDGTKKELSGKYQQVHMSSDYPLMARANRAFHCLITEFNGGSDNATPRARLYLYKMNINAQFPTYYYRGNNGTGNNTYGVDYCIPFANAAVMMAFFIGSSMVLLIVTGVAMLMTAKSNTKWDTAAQKLLLRD